MNARFSRRRRPKKRSADFSERCTLEKLSATSHLLTMQA